MLLLEGKPLAEKIKNQVQARVENFRAKTGRAPHLTVLLIGDDVASQVYVKSKAKSCEKLGMSSAVELMPSTISQAEVEAKILALNADPLVDGVLIQLPVPRHLNSNQLINLLDPAKDVDALTLHAAGGILSDTAAVYPCTPFGIVKMLEHYQIPLTGKHAVVIGRSMIVGKPMAMLLLQKNMTVTMAHSKTENLPTLTRSADVVVVAAGKAQHFGEEYFTEKSVIIDVGIHGSGSGGKICGDVRFEELRGKVKAMTPVPGGVGPLTIACLMENTLTLAELRCL